MAVASPFFRSLPLDRYGLEWIQPAVRLAHPFDDGDAALLVASAAETGAALGEDARAWQRLVGPFLDDWDRWIEDALAPPIRVPRRPLTMARLGWLGLRSASGLARGLFRTEKARAFFAGIAAHTLLPLERSPSAAFGIMLAVAGHSVGWPVARGGSMRIADALAAALADHGGRILTNSAVASVAELSADAIVLDLTPRQVLSVARQRFPERYRRRLESFRYGPGVFKIDWALSEPIPWTAPSCRAAVTVHLGATSAEISASARAAWYGREDDRPFVLLAQPTIVDASRAPAGKHTAWAYCHVPHASAVDMTERIERQVERFAPGFKDTILARHTMNAGEMQAHNPNLVGGDINGGVQDVAQLLFRPVPRLNPYATPDPAIFICSASTPPGGGVHGMCGHHAARAVIRRFAQRTS